MNIIDIPNAASAINKHTLEKGSLVMRYVHVIDSLILGGAERLLCNFIKEHKRINKDAEHYLIFLRDDKPLITIIEEYIEGYFIINFSKYNWLGSILKFRRRIKKLKPHIVHSHLFYSTIVSRVGTPKDIPVVSTYHNMEYCKESPNFSPKYAYVDRLTFSTKKHFSIYVSNAVKDCVQNGVPAQINHSCVIPNFVTSDYLYQYEYNDDNQIRMIAVGNLKKVKNHLYALKEIASVSHINVSLDIYGAGLLHDELLAFIKEKGLKVRLMGRGNITSSLLCSYDLFLLPSLSEGMPVSLIEAITSGLPSLISDLPQLRETAENAALYFSPTKPGSLSSLLETIYQNKKRLIPLSAAAKVLAVKYSWEHHYNAIQKVYNQVLNK